VSFNSHTFVQPRTVMVVALHTVVADCAVLRPRSPNYLAVWAQVSRINFCEKVHVGKVCRIWLDDSRILHASYCVEQKHKNGKDEERKDGVELLITRE